MANRLINCQHCAVSLPSNLIPRHEAGCIGSPPSLARLHLAGRVTREPSGCLVWNAKRNSLGYGLLTDMSTKLLGERKAHRAALTLVVGPSPGHRALHECDNPPCLDTEHLRWGTQADNAADAHRRGRASPPPRWNHLPRETLPCPVCGQEFTRPAGSKNPKQTCSQSCGAALAFSRRSPDWVSPLTVRVDRVCPICGAVDQVRPSELADHPTCSRSCGNRMQWATRQAAKS